MTLEDRLLSKVQMEPNSGCWLWTAHITTGGYGGIGVDGKKRTAHRVAYEHFVGPVPEGLDLDHLCRVRSCINPDHLEPVTRKENCLRGLTGHASGVREAAKTRCPKGHGYTADNTRLFRGSRRCKECARERRRAYGVKHSERLKQYMKVWRARRAMEA